MRPSKDQWGLELARLTASRATCLRRQVGCVLVNHRGHVLATGYNGVAAGLPHCNQLAKDSVVCYHPDENYPFACRGAEAESGKDLDLCQAIHAEQNALLQCRNVHEIHTCYVTTEPCITCTKLLLNTSCLRVIANEEYPGSEEAREMWSKAGREWAVISFKS